MHDHFDEKSLSVADVLLRHSGGHHTGRPSEWCAACTPDPLRRYRALPEHGGTVRGMSPASVLLRHADGVHAGHPSRMCPACTRSVDAAHNGDRWRTKPGDWQKFDPDAPVGAPR